MNAQASFLCFVSGQKTFNKVRADLWSFIFRAKHVCIWLEKELTHPFIELIYVWEEVRNCLYDDIKTINAFVLGDTLPLDPRCLLCLMKGQIPLINRKEWMMVVLVKLSNPFYFGDKHLEVKDGDSQLPGSLSHRRLQWQRYTLPSVRLPKKKMKSTVVLE